MSDQYFKNEIFQLSEVVGSHLLCVSASWKVSPIVDWGSPGLVFHHVQEEIHIVVGGD